MTVADVRTVILPSGTLQITLKEQHVPLESITRYAVRQNPRRGFLFVSRILGKHLPVRPSEALKHHQWLARSLPADAPGPVLFVGMAETATGMSCSIFEAYAAHTGRSDALYLPSTRYRLGDRAPLSFQETHSHATDHLLYPPAEGRKKQLWEDAQTLVLIDDEITTGKTLQALTHTLKGVLPRLQRVHLVCFTSWLDRDVQQLEALFGLPVQVHALVTGSMTFEANPDFAPPALPAVVGNGADKSALFRQDYARLGRVPGEHALPEHALQYVQDLPKTDLPVLVLGTGEFAYEPLRFALELEKQGHEVLFHTTTRSPILPGEVIESRLEFPDNYADGIPNYLYNYQRDQYARVLVCFETLPTVQDEQLIELLQAEAVYF